MATAPFLCLVWALTDPPPGINIPGFPTHPIAPGGGQGGQPSQPIYHPGHPDHGLPPFPSQGLPGQGGGRPDQGLPAHPDQGLPEGEEIHIDNELPPVPPEYEDKTIVAIKRPQEEWVFRAYDPVEVDNSLPQTPEPK